uniref:Uncharacterized protein n=1 Tax=viral metagenome TaxID=1070528 RepID=A0A6C0LL35_9ZZZZ
MNTNSTKNNVSAPSNLSENTTKKEGSGGGVVDLMKGPVFYPIIGIMVFLLVMLILILSGTNLNEDVSDVATDKDATKITGDIFLIIFVCILVFLLSIALIPNFKELKDLFEQIGSVTYVLVYTIFLILFFSLTSNSTLDTYAYAIVPFTALLGAFVFYKATTTNYLEKINLNYERIKSMILLFCLITIFIIYYNNDPGGLIQEYFGYSLLLTIITTVFAFLYLIVVITLGHKDTKSVNTNASGNLLQSFSKFGAYGSVLFFIFLIAVTVIIVQYPGGFFSENNKARAGGSIIIILLICILAGMLFISNLFPELSNKNISVNKLDLFKRSLLMLFGTILSILIILWLVYNLQHLSGQSSILSFIINVFLVLSVLSLIYKIVFTSPPSGNNAKQNAFGQLIINLIFYIPCIFSNIFDGALNLTSKDAATKENSHWYMLLLAILLFIVYFSIPIVYRFVSQQGGKLLINKPIYTNTEYALGNYQYFSNGAYDYNYAISFWIFFDAFPPSTNSNYNKYASILSYGNKPNVLYNASKNTLMVTMKHDNDQKSEHNTIELDEDGNRILLKQPDILLQKWNNIIINYNGGVMDIFINGELIKSNNGVVPYYTLDNLTVGENNGYIGGMCNLVYHKKNLTANNIYFIYNSLKATSPPVTHDTNVTIVDQ